MVKSPGNTQNNSSQQVQSGWVIEDIVIGCRNNNRKSQQQLFEWLQEYSVAVCYRYANNITEVQDLVSDGFMKVYKNISQYNGKEYGFSEASFKGWFKRVLINNCINYLKQYNHQVFMLENDEGVSVNDIVSDDDVVGTLNKKEILKSVKELPQSYKTVFSLFAIDGYTHEEIAQLLGISIGTSKSNLFKARQHLQKSIAAL
jgi:RNA polymerase sigma factor (sigma-70 family)